MFINLYVGFRRGERAPINPWGGTTLEWTVPTPPPLENFHEIPEVKHEPYYHAQKDEKENS